MKKLAALIIMVLCRLYVFADYNGTVTTSASELTFTTKSGYDVVSFSDLQYTSVVGAPQIPIKTLSFLIPIDQMVSGITINSTTTTTLPGTYNILPFQTPTQNPGSIPFDNPNPLIYGSASPYPGVIYDIRDDGYPFGYHVVTIRFYPVKYIPSAQTLNLYTSINFTINYAANTASVLRPSRQSVYSNDLSKSYVKSIVANPADIGMVSGGALQVVGNGSSAANLRGMTPTEVVSIPDYVIITSAALVGTSTTGFKKLADWKTQKGISTMIVTIEDIYANYTGADNAEKIRNYLKDVYINFGSTYVLLGGDVKNDLGAELMPVRRVSIFLSFYETDLYFGTVQGNWNANGNNIYGESTDAPDYSAVYFVGRSPVHKLTEATAFANKIINYENLKNSSNVLLSDLNYVKNMCFMDGLVDYATLNSMDAPTGIVAPSLGYNVLKLYDPTSAGAGSFILNHTNAMSALNTGGTAFSLSYNKMHVNYHIDHSGFDNMSTGSQTNGGGIGVGDMDALVNGDYSSIMFSDGCHTNNFVNNSVSKHYINNTNGGGVAFIGNADVGWFGDTPMFTTYFMDALYSNSKVSGFQNYDNANYHVGYLKWWSANAWGSSYQKNRNLLGDPEMMVWTNTPQNLTVAGVSYSATSQNITGTISGLTFVATPTVVVTVTAWKDGEIWKTVDINATTASVPFTLTNVLANTVGNITLTVNAHNYIPNISSISVPTIAGAHPYKTADQIIDNGTIGSTGNGDNYPETGETIALPVTLTNSGTLLANNVTATLSWTATSPYQTQTGPNATITILNPNSSFGNIASLANATNGGSEFTFSINTAAFDGITPRPLTQFINFTLDIYINGVFYISQPFAVEIGEPNLIKGENKLVSGTLLAGSANQLNIKLYNIGLGEAVGLSAVLTTNNPSNVTVTTPNSTYANIAAVDNATNFGTNLTTFNFLMGGANYTNETFNLTVTNAYGRVWNFNNFSLMLPGNNFTVTTTGQLTSIDHVWTYTPNPGDVILGYNLYRSLTGLPGSYLPVNTNLIPYSTYQDLGLNQLTLYYYQITAVNVSGNESAPYAYTGSTSLGFHTGWPVAAETVVQSIVSRSEGSPNVYDVSSPPDGKKEIFFTSGFGNIGGVWAFNEDASRWYSYDGNVTDKSGYINYNCHTEATPAISDIDNDGIAELGITTAYDASSANSLKLWVYDVVNTSSTPPVNQVGFPTPSGNWEMFKGVVFSDVDNDGTKEVLSNNFGGGSVIVKNPDGTPQPWADVATHNFGWSMPVAFDFDHDGNKEIVIGASGINAAGAGAGIYIYKQDGTNYLGTNPVYIPAAGWRTDFSPVIVDLDNDKLPEILFISANNYTAKVFAMKPTGTFLSGWNPSGTHPSFSLSTSVSSNSDANLYNGQFCTNPVVGDMNKDGLVEVVFGDNGNLYVYPNTGGNVPTSTIPISGFTSSTLLTPVIADVDNNPADLEIVTEGPALFSGTNIYSFKMNGTPVVGFPIFINDAAGNSPCVADIDGNGTNELIVTAGANFYVWDSPGLASNNEYGWTSYRHDAQNTGVFLIENDLYVKDIPADDGTEPLPGYNAWNLCDGTGVWLRNTPAAQTSTNPPHYTFENQHQNAEWSSLWATTQSSRPHVYAKVNNRGSNTVSGTVHFYYHKFSTSDLWNSYSTMTNTYGSWEEILCGDTDGDGLIGTGETLCGDANNNGIIDGTEVSPNFITLAPGQDGVIETIWNNVAQSAFMDPSVSGNRDEWCILVRLESAADPIVGEILGTSAGNNAQMINNITQKNVMFVNNVPGIVCNPFDYGNLTALTTRNKLKIADESSDLFYNKNGAFKIDLGQQLYDAWVQGGRQGSGITDGRKKYQHISPTGEVHNHIAQGGEDTKPYQVIVTSPTATLGNITLAPFQTFSLCVQFDYFEGPATKVPFKYNLYQLESQNNGNFKFTGAVNYYIDKPECPKVTVSKDVTIGKNCSTNISVVSVQREATYTWRNNKTGAEIGTGANLDVSPKVTTSYEVEMTLPNHCISYAVITVYVDPSINCNQPCRPVDYNNLTLSATTVFDQQDLVIKGNLKVPANMVLKITDSKLHFKQNSGIEIMPGGKLVILNSRLSACDITQKWDGIVVKGSNTDANQLSVSGSSLTDATIPVKMNKVNGAIIVANIFDNGTTAIEMTKCKDFTIAKNQFTTYDVGVSAISGLLDVKSIINENTFTNVKTAVMLEGGNYAKLDITCNIFDSYTNYAIYSDSTILKDQGSIAEGVSNLFISNSVIVNNKVRHKGNNMNYYYDPSNPVTIVQGNGMNATAVPAQKDGMCMQGVNVRAADPETEAEIRASLNGTDNKNSVNCIPNPASYKAVFVYSIVGKPITAEIRVTNVLGDLIERYKLDTDSKSIEMDCTNLQNGVYYYSLIIDNTVMETKKMVIAK